MRSCGIRFTPKMAPVVGCALKAKDSASSSDEIAVFQAYTNLINSERETLWARHNALLLANSLIVGALAISPTTLFSASSKTARLSSDDSKNSF